MVVVSAVVLSAVMAMMLPVVAAHHVGVEGELARQQVGHGLVGAARYPAVEGDSGLGQGGFGSPADAAADEGVHALAPEQAGQSPVAAAAAVQYRAGGHLAVLHLIDLEGLGVTEVLKDLSVVVGNCDFHG